MKKGKIKDWDFNSEGKKMVVEEKKRSRGSESRTKKRGVKNRHFISLLRNIIT